LTQNNKTEQRVCRTFEKSSSRWIWRNKLPWTMRSFIGATCTCTQQQQQQLLSTYGCLGLTGRPQLATTAEKFELL
jgi:hypothetical protein